ncbi:hypothetical protein GCM10008013_19280 [Paenibacillus segetis]|uniref:Uncharacterized protein n=1 Tax=Paenibacillus segetis TaxID=1325360 RepID=A0ABQ1YEH0_9BACL|nr:hypothetical protein GCM10008013_19280 [Paenibacillus segetis]
MVLSAPPNRPIKVAMTADRNTIEPNEIEDSMIAIRIMNPVTAFSINMTWEMPLKVTEIKEDNVPSRNIIRLSICIMIPILQD